MSGRGTIANSSYPVCAFAVRAAAARRMPLSAEVDTEPDPYGILGRTVDESAQAWPARTHPAPVNVNHLGLAADWFPASQQLQTTDGVRLVIITVGGRAPMRRKVSLAVAVARTYLGRLEPKLATGPAP